jgi:predicted CXXCH cytochrome family protein
MPTSYPRNPEKIVDPPCTGRHPVRAGHRPPRGRRTSVLARNAALVVLPILASFIYFGCGSDESRYKVLSFFFDGVPNPNEPTPPAAAGPDAGLDEQGHPVAAPAPGQPPPVPVVSEHSPYKNRECFACHQTESSLVATGQGAATCRKCHADYLNPPPDQWVHGPAVLELCTRCHEPHKSQYASLLTKPARDLCLGCHTEPGLLDRPEHRATADKACSACHDPHMAGNRLLLVDAGTAKRRHLEKRPALEHAPYKERKCTLCHVPEASNALVANLDKVCLTCHEKVLAAVAGLPHHKALDQGKCVVCHSPHSSPLPAMIRPTAEQMCFSCHKVDDIRKPGHPLVERADCLLCHKGHASEHDHLLRSDASWSEAPPAKAAPATPQTGSPPAPRAEDGIARPGP